jgi:hypothetical protein
MKTLVKLSSIVAVAIFAATQAHASAITNDTFTYANGDLQTVSGGIWSNFSGTVNLNVTNLNGNGLAVVTGINSKDDQLIFDGTHHVDILFASFDWIPLTLAGSAGGAYFSLFKDSSTFNFEARTMVTNFAGAVRIGIANAASAASAAGVAYWPSTTALGTTNRVTVELNMQNGGVASCTLWLNASNITDPFITATDIPSITNISVIAWALRQSNGQQGGAQVDNLVIGTTPGDVGLIPEPSTVMLVGIGLVGLMALRRRR